MTEMFFAILRILGTAILMVIMLPVASCAFFVSVIVAAIVVGWNAGRQIVHYTFFRQEEDEESES
jgi:uncharacterized membrane protein